MAAVAALTTAAAVVVMSGHERFGVNRPVNRCPSHLPTAAEY